MFDAEGRIMKSKKVLEILHDYLGNLSNLNHLDLGCSTGFMTCLYSKAFKSSVGVDIDVGAIDFASKNNSAVNLKYFVRDAMDTGFSDNSFDVVTCTYIYEHVPNAERLMKEIYRVLTPEGICFFAAGNRFIFWEGHYHLPLLATVPKPLAHLYLRVTGKGTHYYETHFSYWGLKRLASIRDCGLHLKSDPGSCLLLGNRSCESWVFQAGSSTESFKNSLLAFPHLPLAFEETTYSKQNFGQFFVRVFEAE